MGLLNSKNNNNLRPYIHQKCVTCNKNINISINDKIIIANMLFCNQFCAREWLTNKLNQLQTPRNN